MIVDASVLYAAADRSDAHHDRARGVLEQPGQKTLPEPVIVEADYLVRKRLGVDAELAFLGSLEGRWVTLECPTRHDRTRATEIVAQYRDADIGYSDAIIIAIAERIGERVIATLDRRHFSMIRPRHTEAFEIVP